MGDIADMKDITEIEARLTRALDRIAAGVAAGAGDAGAQAEVEAARQDAEAHAVEAAERVSALEARLAETQDALADAQTDLASARAESVAVKAEAAAAHADSVAARAEAEAAALHAAQSPGTDAAALAALEQTLAAAQASGGAAQAELAERTAELTEKDAALAEMQAALDAAQTAPVAANEPDAEPEDIEKALAVMGRRVERARIERDQARTACDAATDALDELREATGATVDERVLTLRRQLRLMRTRAEDLAAQVSLLQSGAGVDASVLDQGLLAEVETLRQLRETDAAELDRIVQEMQAGLDADVGGSHA